MTLLTAGVLTDPQLPATASNVCTTDARLGGVGRVAPQTKILATPASDMAQRLLSINIPHTFLFCQNVTKCNTLKSSQTLKGKGSFYI